MNCPDCNHPVEQHDEFFCMHIGCRCNQGRVTAQARADYVRMKGMLDIARAALENELYNHKASGITNSPVEKALNKISELEEA